MEPVRKIKNHFGKPSIIGKFASLKMKRSIHWESLLERDFAYLLEFDPLVTGYWAQPFKLSYWDGTRKRIYTPDFLVQRTSEKIVVEVKPSSKVSKYADLYRLAETELSNHGYTFQVKTENEIRIDPLLSNIKLLTRYAALTLTPTQLIHPQVILKNLGPVCLQSYLPNLKSAGISPEIAFSLMYRGIIHFDMNRPINNNLLIQIKED